MAVLNGVTIMQLESINLEQVLESSKRTSKLILLGN